MELSLSIKVFEFKSSFVTGVAGLHDDEQHYKPHLYNSAYLGAGRVDQVLISLDALALFKAVAVNDLGLRVAGDDEDDVPCGAVLQGPDLVAAHTPRLQVNTIFDGVAGLDL